MHVIWEAEGVRIIYLEIVKHLMFTQDGGQIVQFSEWKFGELNL